MSNPPKFEKYAYNFNPREGPKDLKLRYMIRQGYLHRIDIPIGTISHNEKYDTPCNPAYQQYNECLRNGYFDRKECEPYELAVIQCEKDQGLYPSNESVIQRLKLGLERSKKRKEDADAMLKEKMASYSTNRKATAQATGTEDY